MLVTEELRKDRIEKLASFLETVPDESFDLDFYQAIRGRYAKGDPAFCNALALHKCGTTACAVGWMPHVDPEHWSYVPEYVTPVVDGDSCVFAKEEYFGMTGHQYSSCFYPREGYTSRQEVIAFLRLIVDTPVGGFVRHSHKE